MRYLIAIMFLYLFISCQHEPDKYEVDSTIDYPVFHDKILNREGFEFQTGVSEISQKLSYKNNVFLVDTCKFCLDAFIDKDTIVLAYENPDCFLYLYLYNGKFKISIDFTTDIAGTYPDDKKYRGTSYAPDLTHCKLILKKDKLKLGDTIMGYLDIETKPFRHFNRMQTNNMKGAFIAKIKDYKNKIPYMLP